MFRNVVLAAVLLAPSLASAQEFYKYTGADGTVSYTDNLANLPPERRAHYNKLIAEREEKRRQLEKEIGKEELERREAEKKRQEILQAQLDEAEKQRRLQIIDQQIQAYKQRLEKRDQSEEQWRKRVRDARAKLQKLMADFEAAKTTWTSLATRVSYTLLPGQAKQRDDAKAEMDRLETEIDATLVEINETIPEEARRAGIPPGWIR